MPEYGLDWDWHTRPLQVTASCGTQSQSFDHSCASRRIRNGATNGGQGTNQGSATEGTRTTAASYCTAAGDQVEQRVPHFRRRLLQTCTEVISSTCERMKLSHVMHVASQHPLYTVLPRSHPRSHSDPRSHPHPSPHPHHVPLRDCALSSLRHRRSGVKHSHSERTMVSVPGEWPVPFPSLGAGSEASWVPVAWDSVAPP